MKKIQGTPPLHGEGRARRALRAFQEDKTQEPGTTREAIVDLVADLLHLAQSAGVDEPDMRILPTAQAHYLTERG